jgi:hypothetical protein
MRRVQQVGIAACLAALTVTTLTACSQVEDGSEAVGTDSENVPSPESRDGGAVIPDVVCHNLQDAQDEIQDAGVFLSRSVDATGQDRRQILDRNWVVVEQSPAPGTRIGEGDALLSVVKKSEASVCDGDVAAPAAVDVPATMTAPASVESTPAVAASTATTATHAPVAPTTTPPTDPPTLPAVITQAPQPFIPTPTPTAAPAGNCEPSYPDFCLPPSSADTLNCADIPYTHFTVLPPDPHDFDGNEDGEGCES